MTDDFHAVCAAQGVGASANDAGLHFVVCEGSYVYPLSTPTAGWGSTLCGTSLARVYALRRLGGRDAWELVAEAELRTFPTNPQENARLFALARKALIQQGCLTWAGRPTDLPGPYRIPAVGLRAHARRVWERLALVVRRRALGRMPPPITQWSIGVLARAAFTLGPAFPWRDVRWFEPPADGFIADPCIVDDGEQTWLFYERLLFAEGKGTLWVANLDCADGSLNNTREALQTDCHLSFPQVFKQGDDWFLLAEQASSGSTSLFRATEFPHRWERYRDLLPDFPGIDPTLFKRGGKWWLFVTHGASPCNENNLHLFMADSLDDRFVAHPMNPIKVGLRGSRMAGNVCELDGRLVRPGQDGTERYGGAVVVFEILQLDMHTYVERELHCWRADPQGEFNLAFHSFAVSSDLIAIDGERTQRARARLAGGQPWHPAHGATP